MKRSRRSGPGTRILAFAPGVTGYSVFGSSIRSRYLLKGLGEIGYHVKAFERDFFPRFAIRNALRNGDGSVFWGLRSFPRSVARAEAFFFEGVPMTALGVALFHWARQSGRITILDFHDDPVGMAEALMGKPLGRRDKVAAQRDSMVANSDFVTFPSKSLRDECTRTSSLRADHTAVVENASDPDHFTVMPAPSQPIVGMISGSAPGKGVATLIEACRLVRRDFQSLKLRIASQSVSGLERSLDATIAGRYHQDHDWIEIRSDIGYREAPSFLAGCSMTVVPLPNEAYFHMALPIKLFDSMAASRPVIVSNCLEMANVVRNERCGLEYNFSPEELADRIGTLSGNPRLSVELGDNGRRAVEHKYNWNAMCRKMVEAIRGVGELAGSPEPVLS